MSLFSCETYSEAHYPNNDNKLKVKKDVEVFCVALDSFKTTVI